MDADKIAGSCTAAAKWLIQYGPTSDDCTEACEVHVGALLADGVMNTLTPVESRAECCYMDQPE
jgi:hypothetical protein